MAPPKFVLSGTALPSVYEGPNAVATAGNTPKFVASGAAVFEDFVPAVVTVFVMLVTAGAQSPLA